MGRLAFHVRDFQKSKVILSGPHCMAKGVLFQPPNNNNGYGPTMDTYGYVVNDLLKNKTCDTRYIYI